MNEHGNVRDWKTFVKAHPGNKMAWYLLGREYATKGERGKAAYCFAQSGEVYEAFNNAALPKAWLDAAESADRAFRTVVGQASAGQVGIGRGATAAAPGAHGASGAIAADRAEDAGRNRVRKAALLLLWALVAVAVAPDGTVRFPAPEAVSGGKSPGATTADHARGNGIPPPRRSPTGRKRLPVGSVRAMGGSGRRPGWRNCSGRAVPANGRPARPLPGC